MNDSDHDFESRLTHVPIRGVPAEWREAVLSAASREEMDSPSNRKSSQLWPHRAAWHALAACWVVILLLRWDTPEPPIADRPSSPATDEDLRAHFAAQEQRLTELLVTMESPGRRSR